MAPVLMVSSSGQKLLKTNLKAFIQLSASDLQVGLV
jgi:hypothetical protein